MMAGLGNCRVRLEMPGDESAVGEVTELAFAQSEWGHHGEATLIARLRVNCPTIVSLVAEVGDRLVGHLLFSPIVVERPQQQIDGMGLAPMSVHPQYQRQGIGSQLVRSGLELLHRQTTPIAVVLGHRNYYARFGFVPAAKFKLRSTYGADADAALMVTAISNCEIPSGIVRYRPEFDMLE